MSSVSGSIGFNVKFNFTGVPAIVITTTTTLPGPDQPNLTGYYAITQPDGITTTGTHASVAWNGTAYNEYSIPLRVGSDQLYQKGTYKIVFFASCPGYDDGTFSRQWDMEYKPVELKLVDALDCFTPSLKILDQTSIQVGDYSEAADANVWNAFSIAGNPTGSSIDFDLAIGGNYYDSKYIITLVKTITYQHDSYEWLSVLEKLSAQLTRKASIPPTMATMLTYLLNIKELRDAAKSNCHLYDQYDEIFEDANGLYQLMRTRVCAQNTTGLAETFDEFYSLTHNKQPFTYINTNGVIPAYDFAAGCTGGGSTPQVYKMRATPGVSSFTVAALAGKNIIGVVRSGLGKGISTSATTDTEQIQITNNNLIALPTGDIVGTTVVDGSTVGELFIFTYL